MKALWALFWSVCQMRRGPDEVPYSLPLLALVTGLAIALAIATQFLAGPAPAPAAVATAFLGATVDALVLWALLAFKRQGALYVQSLATVFGTDFVLGLFNVPLAIAGRQLGEDHPMLQVLVLVQMLLVGWNLGVRGFIYHRSARIGIVQANVLALTLFLLNVFFVVKLFPELLGPGGPH